MANVEEMFQWLQEQRWVLSEDGFLTCTAGDGDIRVFAHSKTVPPTWSEIDMATDECEEVTDPTLIEVLNGQSKQLRTN